MNEWKSHLYENYVSSGQAGGSSGRRLSLRSYPYFRRIIRRHLPPDKQVVIADLACGHGALLHCLRESGYRNISGVDVSPQQVALAHKLGVFEAECGNMAEFLSSKTNTFDVVFLMDILEHLDRTELFDLLALVHRSLKPGGTVIAHVPNAEGLFGMRIRYGDLTHEMCFTPQSIHQLFGILRFRDVRCFEDKPIMHGPNSIVRRFVWNCLTLMPRLLLLAEGGRRGHVLSQNMLVVARRVTDCAS